MTEDPKPASAPPAGAPPAEALAATAAQAAPEAAAPPAKPRRAAARPGLAGAAAAAIGNVVAWIFAFVVAAGILACGGIGVLVYQVGQNLPDHAHLADLQPAVMTRVHAGDGRVFAEYAIERRIFVPLDSIPARLADAFVSAEDKTFWTHPGISVPDILRAAATNAQNWGKKRPIGASTITQQVAKNLLLSNEVSIERKIKEALLSIRLEESLPKQRILELYLNQIYLGFQAYGVASAGLMYFGKSLEDLELHEIAFLAALPKAPNNYNPQRFPERARAPRLGHRPHARGRQGHAGRARCRSRRRQRRPRPCARPAGAARRAAHPGLRAAGAPRPWPRRAARLRASGLRSRAGFYHASCAAPSILARRRRPVQRGASPAKYASMARWIAPATRRRCAGCLSRFSSWRLER